MTNTLHMKHTLLMTTLLSTFSFGVSAQELELKSIFNDTSYNLASICFLPDCSESISSAPNIDINIETNWCKDNGYLKTCPEKTAPIQGSKCIRDNSYVKCSPKQWCINNGYIYESCTEPKILDGDLCEGAAKSCACPADYAVEKCTSPLLIGEDKCEGKAKFCYCPEQYKYMADSDCPSEQIIDVDSEKCTAPGDGTKYMACKNKCLDSYISCTGFYEGVGTSCNGKYAACVYRPENIVCGSYSIPPGSTYSKVVSSCTELQTAINSGITGNIVINGKLDCGNRTLSLKAGQNLIGFGYFYNTEYENYNNEINNCSSISFTNPATYGLSARSLNISHVNLNLDNTSGGNKYLLYPLDNSVALSNVNLTVNGNRSFAIVGSAYSGEGSGQNIEIKKIVNIKSNSAANTHAMNVIDAYVRGNAVLNINNIEQAFSSAGFYTFDNAMVNIKSSICTASSGCFMVWNARPQLRGNSTVNMLLRGSTGAFGDAYPSTSGNVRLNVERESGCLTCRHIYGANATWGTGTVLSLPEGTYKVNSTCSGVGNIPCGSSLISNERPKQNSEFNRIFSSGIFGK